jgi:hypothetical protein
MRRSHSVENVGKRSGEDKNGIEWADYSGIPPGEFRPTAPAGIAGR